MSAAQPRLSWLASGDAREVAAAVRGTFGAVAAGRTLHLHDHLDVGDPKSKRSSADLGPDLLVKFAWSEVAAGHLAREWKVLRLLRTVDATLPVPEVVAASDEPVMMVTRRVAGEWLWYPEASELDGERLDRVATEMAAFLARLHRPDVRGAAEEAGIALPAPRPQATTDALRRRFGAFVDPDRHRRVRAWCDWADEALRTTDEPVLLHGDFAGHNMMWDAEAASIRVFYDFEDCALGDRTYDLRYLPAQADSLRLLRLVVRRYADATDVDLPLDRVMAWHLRTSLGDALWRSEAGVPLPFDGRPAEWVDELGDRLADAEVGAPE